MTLHPNFDEAEIHPLALGDPSGRMRAPSTRIVWAAGASIVLLAGLGLYKGITVGGPHRAEAARVGAGGLSAATAAAAAPVTVLPRDGQWSTLSGPKIDQPAQKTAAAPSAAPNSDDNAADASADDDNQATTADAGPKDALEAVGDAQTAPPVNGAPAAPVVAHATVAPAAPAASAHALPDPDKNPAANDATP